MSVVINHRVVLNLIIIITMIFDQYGDHNYFPQLLLTAETIVFIES